MFPNRAAKFAKLGQESECEGLGSSGVVPEREALEIVSLDADSSDNGNALRVSKKCYHFLFLGVLALTVVLAAVAIIFRQGRASAPDGTAAFVGLPPSSKRLDKIAFGSCAKQTYPHAFWDTIATTISPDLFIMNGDTVYGDLGERGYVASGCEDASCETLRAAYADLAKKPSFQGFARMIPLMPIWDDHDFGLNDGGASFQFKREAQELFLDFWKIPNNDARHARDGLYKSYTYGSASTGRVQIILLDCRFFKKRVDEAAKQQNVLHGRAVRGEHRQRRNDARSDSMVLA